MAAALLSKSIINSFSRRMHTKATMISRKIVKPLSPTPESLSRYKLSSTDQSMPSVYMPFAYFYPAVSQRYGIGASQIFQQIENSLSKTLTYYYPFAGRLGGKDHIICNDAGVELQQIQMNTSMAEIFKHSQEDLFPTGAPWRDSRHQGDSLVVIRVNYFDCGGVTLAACLSHKIADAASVGMFVNDLAAISRQPDHIPSPKFIANTVFPAIDNPISFSSDFPAIGVSRRYIFDAANIEKLKNMAADSGVEKPTRLEVVIAFLHQHVALATSKSDDSGSVKPSVIVQPINLRPFYGSPIDHNSVGNTWALNMVVSEDNSTNFPKLVSELRSAKLKVQNLYKQKLKSSSPVQDDMRQLFQFVIEKRFNIYYCTSACRIPFYDADFGWGKPTRVSIAPYPGIETFFFTDTPGNGIEALISLDEPTMSRFEQDKEFLSFVVDDDYGYCV